MLIEENQLSKTTPILALLCFLLIVTIAYPVMQTPTTAQVAAEEPAQHFFKDNFDDNTFDSTLWEKVQVNGGVVNEKNGQLQVTGPDSDKTWDDWYWSQAGYVTEYKYKVNSLGFEASVNVVELDEVSELELLISDQKITDRDPVNASNWYLINKILNTKYPHENLTRVVSRIEGNVSWKVEEPWISPTGELKIEVSTGAISFYENGVLRYSEPYALPSKECYIYIYTSKWGHYAGTDCFDNFAVSPAKGFRDDFCDGNTNGWIIDNGTWIPSNYQLCALNGTSHIHINSPFSVNKHVRTDIQTLESYGSSASVARLMVKEQDGDNLLYALIATDGTVQLGIVYCGVETVYQASSNLSAFEKHSLAVSSVGDNVKVWVDGQQYIDQTNPYVAYLAGYTGLYCVDSRASFGYVAVLS